MHYSEFHNHKWARGLAHARRLWQAGRFEALYRGEDLPAEQDVYPGLRVMSAYWISVEHEMPLRLAKLLQGADRPDWFAQNPALSARAGLYLERYLEDMRVLVEREQICTPDHFDQLVGHGLNTPEGWPDQLRAWQQAAEEAVSAGSFPEELFNAFRDSCLRSVANYNRFLILGGTAAAALVKEGGAEALQAAVDATSEEFMWEISRAFFGTVLPQAGFEDIGDLMELGLRGMYADQWYISGPERQDGERTIRNSLLKNCELAGIYRSTAEWEGLPPLATGYGICRYCEVHGQATMMISMPPMVSPQYRRVKSLGIDGETCDFELVTIPADDMERILMVQEKVFGTEE